MINSNVCLHIVFGNVWGQQYLKIKYKINLIQEGWVKFDKNYSKDFYMVTKYFYFK